MGLFSRNKDAASRPPVPFIVGVGRSGTTMLRLMLDAHQTLMELHQANVPKFKQVAEFLEQDLRKLGGPR